MFSNIDDFVTDGDLELEGVELDFGKDRFITIRRAGGANKAFANHLADKFNDTTTVGIGKSSIDNDEAKAIMYKAYADFVVLDWRGWLDEGKAIPFSSENCVKLFHASREIYDHVAEQANNLNNFRNKEIHEAGKE